MKALRSRAGHVDGDMPVVLPASPFPDMPERRLLRAVLEDGLRAYIGRAKIEAGWQRNVDRQRSRTQVEAAAWFASPAMGWPCAFGRICEALGIDASWFRRKLREEDGAALAAAIRHVGVRSARRVVVGSRELCGTKGPRGSAYGSRAGAGLTVRKEAE